MNVRVQLFARLRELCDDRSQIDLQLDEPATAADAFDALCRDFPTLRPYRDTLAVAVNEEYAGWQRPLQEGDQVSLIPPVSGGCEDSRDEVAGRAAVGEWVVTRRGNPW